MVRKTLALVAASATVVAGIGVALATTAAASTTIQLLLPQATAFGYLGHSCGGIQEKVYATQFTGGTTGFPQGVVDASTSCGGSGRGGGYTSTTYRAAIDVTWDYAGSVVTSSAPSTTATNPTFTATDAYGNVLYNQNNQAYLTVATGFVPTPTVTGLSVTAGPAAGSTSVTISGFDLGVATGVSFGGTPAASFVLGTDTSMTATTPSEVPGPVDVTVTSAGGTSATGPSDQYTFVAAPVVTGVSPNSGPITGGTPITVTGSGFTGATSVTIGGIYTFFTVLDDNTISDTTPAGDAAGDAVDVVVSTAGGASATGPADQFTYVPAVSPLAPIVDKVTPNFGAPAGGKAVTIAGANFTGATEVDFGTTAVTAFKIVSDTSITTTSPPGTGAVDVTVWNGYGQSLTSTADLFNYGPVVTAVTPGRGSAGGGTKVTIKGHNFLGATEVDFGGQSVPFTVNIYGTAITAKSPPSPDVGVQVVDVTVVGPDGTSPVVPTDTFTYAAPVLTRITPISGSAGGSTKVVIKGTYLYDPNNMSVTFGGVPANSFTVNATGTAITAYTPPEAGTGVTSVDVAVSTTAGTAVLAGGFTYAAPTLTSLSPVSGSPAGGTIVKLVGTNLYGATAVDFGASPATITNEAQTSVTVITPPGTGAVAVTVVTPAGTSGPLTFTY